MGRACSTHWEERNAYRILVGKPIVKRPLKRPRHTWEDNIKMEFGEIGMVVWTEFICIRMGSSGELL
jgi:hypothetical protein